MRDPNIGTGIVPEIGAGVWTSDDERVGNVGKVLGDYFRVDDDEGRERWFGLGLLQSADGERAILDFAAEDLGAREVPAPDDDTNFDATRAQLLPDAQEQREVMLRELAEQREEMHETGKATPAAERTIGEPVEEELERIEDDDGDKPDAPGPTPTMR